jgi:hypothetical protein
LVLLPRLEIPAFLLFTGLFALFVLVVGLAFAVLGISTPLSYQKCPSQGDAK